ncbi:MAG: Hpt domain-containing protein [Deltaproteobacteria bacterium]|nr:Hpt domain-containing protein [Candidatus Anaeroferrophillacea bacterium]
MSEKSDSTLDDDIADQPLLDKRVIEGIRNLKSGRGGLLSRLFAVYRSQSVRLFADIAAGLEHGDAEAVRVGAHTLKSGSAQVGAMQIAALAKEIEYRTGENNLASAGELLARIEETFRRTEKEMIRQLEEMG